MTYKINKKKVYIIAEAGVNHNGKLKIAKKLADASIFQDGFVSIRIFNNKISLKGNLGSQKNIDKVQSIIEEFESIKLIENNIKLKS